MSREEENFVTSEFITSLNMPILTETEDNRICYGSQLYATSCVPDSIEIVTGAIDGYGTNANPTEFQCLKLLNAEWGFLTYWFKQLFPTFEGPPYTSFNNLSHIKNILYIWILRFGAAEMNAWTDIKTAMNGATENWENYIAWIDTDAGFSLDGGATVKPFPSILLAWLQFSCTSTDDCDPLLSTFNWVDAVCYSPNPCTPQLESYCMQVDSGSDCATSR
jgi:hypothetical protein